MTTPGPLQLSLDDHAPQLDPAAFVAPGAAVLGKVSLAAQSSVWYGCVLRGDTETIAIGERTNLQDLTCAHADPGFKTTIGAGVSVGHRVVLHGCTVEDDVLVGMGAVLLNGCRVGAGSLIAAGTVVLEGAQIPPRSLVAGVPGKVRREISDDELEEIRLNAAVYLDLMRMHQRALDGS